LTQKPSGIFFDVIYDPWPTQFALRWEQLEGVVISGLELLVAQGIEQVRLFTGKDVPTTLLSNFLRSEFNL
jgi:shikimate dehydrogenase